MKHFVRRVTVAAALTATTTLALAGCGLSDTTTQEPGQTTVTIYSPRPAAITDYVVAEFEKAHPEFKLNLLTLGGQEVADRVNAESANPQADVWWGGTPSQFEAAVGKDLITAFPAEILDRIPDEFQGTNDAWFAEQQQLQLIAYNKDMISEADLPTDWDDLIDPKYKDQILIRDVSPSGTMRSVYSALIYQYGVKNGSLEDGYAFLTALDANTKDYAANPSDLYLRLQRGEAALTIWNHQDIMSQAALGAPFSILVPSSGVPINRDGVAKVKGAPNSAGADAFVTFLTEETTQTWLANNAFQIPTVEISEKPAWLAPITFKELEIDSTKVDTETWIQYWIDNIKNQG